MFGIVVLHKPVVRKFVSDEWDERRLKYVAKEISIHDAIKDANLSGTMAANSPPDMNFEWMLRFKFFNIPAGWRPWLWRSSIRDLA